MLDNQLISVFFPIIQAGLIAQGFTGVILRQSYQPTQQGVQSTQSVYFHKIGDRRYGFMKVNSYWDEVGSQEFTETIQPYETTFQVDAWAIQDPSNVNSVTASDLVNTVAGIMQSPSTVQTLYSNGIGIYRITDIRNPYFWDDMDQNEASPSFDFTLTHNQTITSPENYLNTITGEFYNISNYTE